MCILVVLVFAWVRVENVLIKPKLHECTHRCQFISAQNWLTTTHLVIIEPNFLTEGNVVLVRYC